MNEEIEYKAMPWSCEAEQSLIGALLLDCRNVFDRTQPLGAEDFYDIRHGAIFSAIRSVHQKHAPVDIVTVFEQLKEDGKDDAVGGYVYLAELLQAVPGVSGSKRYADIVRDRSRQRALISASELAREIAFGGGTMPDRIDKITTLFLGMQRDTISSVPRTLAEIAIPRTEYYERLQNGEVVSGWPTHIPSFDRMLNGGLRGGSLYILAARPSVGKSSFSQTLGLTMAKAGKKVLFLSQEMAAEELADRGVAATGRIDYSALITGKMEQEDWERAAEAIGAHELANFHVDDQPALTLMDVRAKAKQVPGLQVLILDYLQLCSGSSKGDNRNSEIEQISRGMKALAKELNIAVIALSQLNRAVEQRPGKRPVLSDLRDSGSIEQDADVVLFLWPVREMDDGARIVGLGIEKNRQGRCGAFGLHFQGNYQLWHESAESIDYAPPAQSQAPKRRGFDD